jgi:hypothetical protein
MKEFPKILIPKNKHRFHEYLYERNLAYMRRDIYELVIRGDENSYFVIDNFARKHQINNHDIKSMTLTVMKELKSLGWNVKTSFADCGLFIYSTDEVPVSCYDDSF